MFKTIARWFGFFRGPVERPEPWPEPPQTTITMDIRTVGGDPLRHQEVVKAIMDALDTEALHSRDIWCRKATAAEDRLVDQGACLQNTLEENRKLKEDLAEFHAFPKPFSASLLSPAFQLQLFKSEQKAEEESRKHLEVMTSIREALGAQEGEDPLEVIKQLRGQHAEAGRLLREAKVDLEWSNAALDNAKKERDEAKGLQIAAQDAAGKAQAEVERLRTEMRVCQENWTEEIGGLRARLAAIDAAKAGEPPVPEYVFQFGEGPGKLGEYIFKLQIYARKGWDAAAALRLDVEFLVGEWQRLQPAGSPPPGGIRALVPWIRQGIAQKLAEMELPHA